MKLLNITNQELLELGKNRHDAYVNAEPFPNTYFDDFFNPDVLKKVLEEFPDLTKNPDYQYKDQNQVKLAANSEERFGEVTKEIMHFLNSEPFLNFLSALTGIENLIPDPYFLGGGYHQILPGGYLKVHVDFNKHPRNKLDRRLNVLVYLNEDWEEEYGGHFQLFDTSMKECKVKILPKFNRLALFTTSHISYHGHPDPLTCPPGRSRRSLAVYYYTNGRDDHSEQAGMDHTTIFKYRPGLDDAAKKKSKMEHFINLITPPFIYFGLKKLMQRK